MMNLLIISLKHPWKIKSQRVRNMENFTSNQPEKMNRGKQLTHSTLGEFPDFLGKEMHFILKRYAMAVFSDEENFSSKSFAKLPEAFHTLFSITRFLLFKILSSG